MRILYIHQHFCTRQGRTGTRSYEFAKFLVGRGHRVTMLTAASEISDIRIPEGRRTHRVHIDGIDVVAVRVAYSQNMGALQRIWSFVQFMLLSTWHACWARGHDVVFATSTPLTVGIPGVLASWALRIPFVFEVRDLWPEAPIQMGVIRNRMLIAALRGLERFLYRRAAHVVALSPGMRDGVRDAGTPDQKISVIPNCSDLDLFQPGEAPARLLERYDLEDRFVVLHAGSMGASNGLETVIEAAARLQQSGEDRVRFVLLGQGSNTEALRLRARQLVLSNVVFTGAVARSEVADFVRCSDVCLVVFRNLPILATNSPNKMFDALAGGRPVLVNSDGWTRALVERHGVGRYAQPGSTDSLADEISWLLENPEARQRMGQNARALAESEFDRMTLAARLETALRAVVGGSEPAESDLREAADAAAATWENPQDASSVPEAPPPEASSDTAEAPNAREVGSSLS